MSVDCTLCEQHGYQAWQQLSGETKLLWSTLFSPGYQVRSFLVSIPIGSISVLRMRVT